MTRVIKAPEKYDAGSAVTIFLGGSIDMGAAEDWQTRLTNDLSDYDDEDLILLNPRRDDWDSSWVQDPTPGTQFYEQVDWELEQQEAANAIVYYFAADSKSSITLLDLGLFGLSVPGMSAAVVVCCPKEFYRYGNVKMVCDRYGIPILETYEELLEVLRMGIDDALQEE